MAEEQVAGATEEEYEIRPYEPADRADVLALFETVWGTDRSEDWLVQKYEQNPYLDGPPMMVAEAGGIVVAARPYEPFPMRSGSVSLRAVYLNNAMVHPDHRRRGLFTRLTKRTVELFESQNVAFLFNFANELSAPGYRKLGFEEFGTDRGQYLRVQTPGRFIRDRLDFPFSRVIEAAADTAMAGYLSLRSRDVPQLVNLQVDRYDGIPGEELMQVYESDPPETIHTRREESLYQWMANDPHWTYQTYVGSIAGSPEAAVVVRDRPEAPETTPSIVDVLPPLSPTRESVYPALLGAVLPEYRKAAAISVTGPVVNEQLLPPPVLSKFGFVSSDHPLLARFTREPDTAFVYAYDTATEQLDTLDVLDAENWAVRAR